MDTAQYSDNIWVEKRYYHRNDCLIRVDIEDLADNSYKAILRNICRGGAYIEANQPLMTRRREMSVRIPFQKKPGSKTVTGKVVWVGKNGFGINFVQEPKNER